MDYEDIIMALKNGNVPATGTKSICLGRDKEIKEIEYLLEKVNDGKAFTRFVNGEFGAGKSFFLKVIEELAFEKNFVVSWITLSNDIPFNKIDVVYRNIAKTLRCKTGTSLEHIIERWITRLKMIAFQETNDPQKQNQMINDNITQDLKKTREHSNSFATAIECYNKLMDRQDYKTAQFAQAWLRGDSNIPFTEKRKFGVKGDITKENAIDFLEALSIFVKSVGYSGLVVLIDEAEFIMNLHTSKLRDIAYNYIRDIYDNCNMGKFENTLFIFAGTPQFFDDVKKGVPSYEALHDRIDNPLKTDFKDIRKPIIDLEGFTKEDLIDISGKLMIMHNEVYKWNSNDKIGPINEEYPNKYERLLGGDIWCMIKFDYYFDDAVSSMPFKIKDLQPIQMPYLDINEILTARKNFTKEEWIDLILRSCGMEPTQFDKRVKWLLIARLIPLVENNFNLCELGPRGTGKSHIYKEISPNSILVSGGQTTVANLFYNMTTKKIGLVGSWDCVAFDEVAGIKFKDQDGIAIMKDYMASGSFSRGREEKNANASMVFVGNINQSVDSLLKTSDLFEPFPETISNDTAFFDRFHCYIPGWEIPKYRPEYFTNDYGLITDYLAEFLREMRKKSFSDAFDEYFKLGNNLNQRDVIAVRKMVSGLVKIVYPDGKFDKEDVEEILKIALESRRRVKEQLKKIGGMEFYDVNFSYIDNENLKEEFVTVKEQGAGKLIPEGLLKPGQVYSVGPGENGKLGLFKIEAKTIEGTGIFKPSGIGSKKDITDTFKTSFNFLKSNAQTISGKINTKNLDYLMEVQDLNKVGMSNQLSLASFIALCSAAINKPVLSSVAILGSMSLGGTINKVQDLASTLQVCLDNGAKKIVIPMSSSVDLGTVPPELMGKFNIIFYSTPEDAVFKALGAD